MRETTGVIAVLLSTALAVASASAQVVTPGGDAGGASTAPGAAPPAGAAPTPLDLARTVFMAFPPERRTALQDALVWTGDYSGPLDGELGRGGFAAIQAFERRAKGRPDGLLDAQEQAALLAAGEAAKKAARFSPVTDPRAKLTLGVPLALFDPAKPAPAGTVWSSKDGRIRLETVVHPDGVDLAQLFELTKAESPGRKVTYQVIKPDWFVVTTETADRLTYIRVGQPPGQAPRGFAFVYDKARKAEFDRIAVAISNSFRPDGAAGPSPQTASPGTPTAPPVAAKPTGVVATGLLVGPGRVLTAAAVVKLCPEPSVGGQPARVEKAGQVAALLTVSGGTGTAPPEARAEGEVVVLGHAAGDQGSALTVVPGAVEPAGAKARLRAALQPGMAGAAVFDRAGGFAGLVTADPGASRKVAGVVPFGSWSLATAAEITADLGGALTLAPAAAGPAGSSGSVARTRGPAMVAITCGK